MSYPNAYAAALKYSAGQPTDHEAFAAGMAKNLHDTVGPLAYADFLEEAGHGGAARLIRDRPNVTLGHLATPRAEYGRVAGQPFFDVYDQGRDADGNALRAVTLSIPHPNGDFIRWGHYHQPAEAVHAYLADAPDIANADHFRRELEARHPWLRRPQ